MTEAEWLACDEPQRMLRLRRTDCCGCFWMDNGDGTVSLCAGSRPCGQCDNGPITPYAPWSDRKLRLFACACCRQDWSRVTDEWSQRAVIIAERHVEGLDDLGRMPQMHRQAFRVPGSERPGPLMAAAECCNPDAATAARRIAQLAIGTPETKAALLRDVVGNPYRPATLPLRCRCGQWEDARDGSGRCKTCYGVMNVCPWLTPRVLSIARAAYDERDWERLPVLADALENEGCENRDILDHLRGPGPHVRGCWCVDLLLGKG